MPIMTKIEFQEMTRSKDKLHRRSSALRNIDDALNDLHAKPKRFTFFKPKTQEEKIANLLNLIEKALGGKDISVKSTSQEKKGEYGVAQPRSLQSRLSALQRQAENAQLAILREKHSKVSMDKNTSPQAKK